MKCSLCKKDIGIECLNCGGKWLEDEEIFCSEDNHWHTWCFEEEQPPIAKVEANEK